MSILLIEDDEDDYVIIQDLLSEIEGFDLEWVDDYDAGVEAIESEEYDVCLLDYRLGERSGLDLLRETSRRGLKTPVILLTGLGDREVDLQAMQAGAVDYLIKGRIEPPLLERAIRYAFTRTLRALGESERRFRALAQNASDVVAILDADGVILYESPSVERALGYRPEDLVGESVFEYVHPDDLERVSGSFVQILENPNNTQRLELRFRHMDGSWRWLESVGSDLRHEPAVKGVVVNSRDVTERKEAEERLRDSEARYRALIEQTPAITYIEALNHEAVEHKVLYVSPQIEELLGYTPEEWMSDPSLFAKLLHPDDREWVIAEGERTERTGEPFSAEYRNYTKDGDVVWLRNEARLVRDDSGVPLYWQGVMSDVTERKQTEESLRSALGSLLALYEAGQILGSTLKREEIFSWLLEIVQRISDPETAAIDLYDNKQRLRPHRVAGPKELWRQARTTPEAQAARQEALETGERRLAVIQRAGDTEGEHLVGLYVPLRARDRPIGMLEAYGSDDLSEKGTVEAMASLAGQAASALENARLYAELAERERQLRDLVRQVLVAQEEERRRVAYEVHDGLAQTIAAAHQLLQAFARHHSPGSGESRDRLDRVVELVQRAVGEARAVIADLRPTVLDDFGLATAVRQQVERLRVEGLQIDYQEGLGEERLPAETETTLYRVLQEALTNVRKHAPSARVLVTLERVDGSVHLRIRDWGQGFSVADVANGGGPGERVGVSSMRERVGLLGGTFEIRSEPGGGTEVVAEVPLPQEDADHDV